MSDPQPNSLVDTVLQARSVQLHVPEDTPSGKYWVPHQHVPSVILGRIDQVTGSTLPRVATGDIPSKADAELVLTERIGWTKFVDIYYASLRSPSGDLQPGLVVKVVDLSMFPPVSTRETKRYFPEKSLAHEFPTMQKLSGLQGNVVPRYAGLFGRGTVYCTVWEDAGRLLTPTERRTRSVADEVLNALKAANGAEVAVYLLGWTDLCRGRDGLIKLTNFESANTVETDALQLENDEVWIGMDKPSSPEELFKRTKRDVFDVAWQLFPHAWDEPDFTRWYS